MYLLHQRKNLPLQFPRRERERKKRKGKEEGKEIRGRTEKEKSHQRQSGLLVLRLMARS